MDLGLTGKRALVLASSRGLGFGIARALAAEGATVGLCGRDPGRLASAVDSINALRPGSATAIPADMMRPDGIDSLTTTASQELGTIDILVNNVGGPPAKAVSAVAADEWRTQFEAMVVSVMRVTAHVLPGMRAQKWGRILTIASSGVIQPIPNLGISNSLRSSLIGWSKTLAAEVAHDGVTVNVIIPGRILTERVREIDAQTAKHSGKSVDDVAHASYATIPMGRYGTVEEFAAVTAFLVSGPASYMTGSLVRVDGGYIRSV